MVALKPEVRELLQAIEDLDGQHRGLDSLQRSLALAYLGGVVRGVLQGAVEPQHAAAAIREWTPGDADPLPRRERSTVSPARELHNVVDTL